MKNINLLIVAFSLSLFCKNAESQINMTSTGHVEIGASVPNTNFQVGSNASWNSSTISIGSDFRICGYNSGTPWAFVSARDSAQKNNIGLYFRTQTTPITLTIPGLGSITLAGGLINAMCISPTGLVGIGLNGTLPAYYLDCAGSIRASSFVTSSDSLLKSNIKNLSNSLSFIKKLRPVTYNFKVSTNINNLKDSVDHINIENNYYSRIHHGFIAQDVQKINQDFVYADQNGILSLDYQGFISDIIGSIQEITTSSNKDSVYFSNQISLLKSKIQQDSVLIQQLFKQIAQCCGKEQTAQVSSATVEGDNMTVSSETPHMMLNSETNDVAILYQNAPNPFYSSTTISYHLPSTTRTATIYIYNMQGLQIKSVSINGIGNGLISLNGSELAAGMYLYSLIINGQVIDTKRMILTN